MSTSLKTKIKQKLSALSKKYDLCGEDQVFDFQIVNACGIAIVKSSIELEEALRAVDIKVSPLCYEQNLFLETQFQENFQGDGYRSVSLPINKMTFMRLDTALDPTPAKWQAYAGAALIADFEQAMQLALSRYERADQPANVTAQAVLERAMLATSIFLEKNFPSLKS